MLTQSRQETFHGMSLRSDNNTLLFRNVFRLFILTFCGTSVQISTYRLKSLTTMLESDDIWSLDEDNMVQALTQPS